VKDIKNNFQKLDEIVKVISPSRLEIMDDAKVIKTK